MPQGILPLAVTAEAKVTKCPADDGVPKGAQIDREVIGKTTRQLEPARRE